MMNHAATDEAKAIRRQRRALRNSQADDPLAERQRVIAFWRKCAETNRHYTPHNGAWWWVFTWNPAWQWVLMPRLRARQIERERARKAKHAAELQAEAEQWRATKAARAAAKAHESALLRPVGQKSPHTLGIKTRSRNGCVASYTEPLCLKLAVRQSARGSSAQASGWGFLAALATTPPPPQATASAHPASAHTAGRL